MQSDPELRAGVRVRSPATRSHTLRSRWDRAVSSQRASAEHAPRVTPALLREAATRDTTTSTSRSASRAWRARELFDGLFRQARGVNQCGGRRGEAIVVDARELIEEQELDASCCGESGCVAGGHPSGKLVPPRP